MVVLWYTLITGWIGSLVAMVATGLWLAANPDEAEPKAALAIAVTVFVFTTIGVPVQYFFSDEMRKRRAKTREDNRTLIDHALDSIKHEMGNFSQIAEKKKYSGADHQKAVEVQSFKVVREDMESLMKFWRYRLIVRHVLAECERNRPLPAGNKDVSKIIPILEDLIPMLERHLKKLGGAAAW